MKYATRTGSTVNYYGKPPITEHKKYREPVKLETKKCWCRVTAAIRKWLYEAI